MLPKVLVDEEGASLVEYSVLIGVVAAAVISVISYIGGTRMDSVWGGLSDDWACANYQRRDPSFEC